MNCREAESCIFVHRDAGTAAAEELARHLESCPACRAGAEQLEIAVRSWRQQDETIPVPSALSEWHAVRRRIREEQPATSGHHFFWRRLGLWALPTVAAVALIGYLAFRPILPEDASPSSPHPAFASVGWEADMHTHFAFTAYVEFVETDDSDVSPFVYLDDESGWLIVWARDPTDQPSI